MITRRSVILGLLAAPAVVRAESLMKLWVPPKPRVVMAMDVGSDDVTVGSLWGTAGQIVGWWSVPKGMNFNALQIACENHDITPYWPRPFASKEIQL